MLTDARCTVTVNEQHIIAKSPNGPFTLDFLKEALSEADSDWPNLAKFIELRFADASMMETYFFAGIGDSMDFDPLNGPVGIFNAFAIFNNPVYPLDDGKGGAVEFTYKDIGKPSEKFKPV